ncbi:family 16 glycosylhydrolase [Mycolicibacterium iranicum]|uniref:GH16 domain-containing protein n=1 Tax=Mycolicibacterium iranicum TaxID=912594 RepID=A0A178LPW9_MYCIR|nr:family 16 glycosylhydrolase [Mycolicibacterium iranicum]OAN32474.1 hypothetical protein A4X20_08075 [Mycolicibacterium iranicum]
MTPSNSLQSHSISMSRVGAAVAFTGGATACFLLAGTPAPASAETGAGSDSSDAAGPSANGGTDAAERTSRKDAAEGHSDDDAADTGGDEGAATSDGDADAEGADETPVAEDEDPAEDEGDRRTRKRDTTKPSDDADLHADDGDLDAQETAVDAPRPSTEKPHDAASSNDDAEPPATFAALARAAADTESPSFFTWIQRTFFNKTPTVSQEPDEVEVRSDGSVTGVILADDADGDVLTYSARALAAGATVTIDDDGSFVYRPAAGSVFDGGDLFSVQVSDDAEENGWRIHGLMGLLVPGFGSTATTTVELGAATAAGRYGWGAPRETRFSGPSSLDGWVVYDSVGHNGWGRRTPRAISFVDGVMVITGDAFGNTGGLTWGGGQKYGAWEVRMRVPEGAVDYHAVALLWPDAENWPVGGEVDFVEVVADAKRQHVSHHLHYSALDLTEAGVTNVDATEWHNYAVSWTPTAITIYVDSVPVWRTTNTSHFPPGPMHLALQLDASEKHPPNLAGGAQIAVAWARQYSLSQIS